MPYDTRGLMADAKFFESYSRYDETKKRYETWPEAVDRVMSMHRGYYADKIKESEELSLLIQFAESMYKNKSILGAQRALQYGGDQLLKHQIKMYNCLAEETSFLTKEGMKSFRDFRDGDEVSVMTHRGVWKPAIVKEYGAQELQKITFRKTSSTKTVYATKNHRWLLHDGSWTDDLKEGDRVFKEPSYFREFDYETAPVDEQLYWCYGYVYGDGTVGSNGYSKVRLCKRDVKYEKRFLENGFKSSSTLSLEGDVICYTGTYKKTTPDPRVDRPELLRAFIAGFLAADGTKNNNEGGKQYSCIQSTGSDSIEFIRKMFPIGGVHIISEIDLTGKETNFGTRPYTIKFGTCDHSGSKYNMGWKVEKIEETSRYEKVWCLEVEDDQSFILEGGIVTGNCVSSHCNRVRFFQECMYMLLCGAGAGFSVQKHHIAKLPNIAHRTKSTKMFTVEDSIEGWSDAVGVLLSSYFEGDVPFPEYQGRRVYFDLNKIRPKGAFISGGFKAPGPEPLRKALDLIEKLLEDQLSSEQTRLKPIVAYDIIMHIADAVISGGVRRSATICLFSHDDEEMIKAKTGNWFNDNPQRGRSNNSAVILRDEITWEEFEEIMESVKQFGEPGFIFTDDKEFTYNPCVEIGKLPVTEDGRSGWQGCNLSEINGALCTDEEKFFAACKAASIIGTLQAGYTDFKYLAPESKEIFEREALIGVSVTGWMNNPDVLFDEETMKKGAEIVKQYNRKTAALIGINAAARTTCVKPSGNASVILKSASGIHGEHAPLFIRNAQMNKDNEIPQLIKQKNPAMVEDSVWGSSDYVISFPVVSDGNSKYKDELYGTAQLEYVKKAQKYWVEYGTDEELCADKRLRHNVSNTITVLEDQWEEVTEYVFNNRNWFCGISFLSSAGDKDYDQAPFIEVLTEDKIVAKYGVGAMFASGLVVDALSAFGNLWTACYYTLNDQQDEDEDSHKTLLARDWKRRARKFAVNHFDGDVKKMTYCLKDVHILHKWHRILKNYQTIDWTSELAERDYTDIDTMSGVACSGGVCEIQF